MVLKILIILCLIALALVSCLLYTQVAPTTSNITLQETTSIQETILKVKVITTIVPVDLITMPASHGHHWSRRLPDRWKLKAVTIYVANRTCATVKLDMAVILVDNKTESIPLNVSLKPTEYKIITIPASIKGIETGEYDLTVELYSQGILVSERTDKAKVYWKEK